MLKKTKLNWVYNKDAQTCTATVESIGWVFFIDGAGLKGKHIPCLLYKDEKEEAEVCLAFKAVTLSAAKSICQKKFDKHVKSIIKNFA